MITYPVSPNTKFTIYKISTDSIINKNAIWPRADGFQIEGQDSDYIYLQHIENNIPAYDPDYYIPTKTEVPDVANEAWIITWTLVKRSTLDIKQLLGIIDDNNFSSITDSPKFNKLLVQAIFLLYKRIPDIELTASELKIKNKIKALRTIITENDTTLSSKTAEVDGGLETNLRDGWISEINWDYDVT